MVVVDHEPQYWFLLREENDYHLSVRCQRGFVNYSMLIRFTPEERAAYHSSGRPYAATLAANIADHPAQYEERDHEKELGTHVTQTVVAWRAAKKTVVLMLLRSLLYLRGTNYRILRAMIKKQPRFTILLQLSNEGGSLLGDLTRFLVEATWNGSGGTKRVFSEDDYNSIIEITEEDNDWSDSNFSLINCSKSITTQSFIFALGRQSPDNYRAVIGEIGNLGLYFVLINRLIKPFYGSPIRLPDEYVMDTIKSAIAEYIAMKQ